MLPLHGYLLVPHFLYIKNERGKETNQGRGTANQHKQGAGSTPRYQVD